MEESHFSTSYHEARRRFRDAAESAGATLRDYHVPHDVEGDLTIDVATVGGDAEPTIVTSSGVHGVEGFMGSAIQLALLQRLAKQPPRGIRHLLIHAVNPYGFAVLRRFNEDNVDLNRNFLEDPADYRGSPDGYTKLNHFLNPQSPPSRLEPFKWKAIYYIGRFGLQALKQSVAGGQYEYPKGIFFGGDGPSASTRIVFENCDSWIAAAERIVHVDFHSGLGRFGSYRLLLAELDGTEEAPWYADAFGIQHVEAKRIGDADSTAYRTTGPFGAWLQQHFAPREYRFVTAEYGTYDPIRVLGAIRAENRAHHYSANDNSSIRQHTKTELLECFCPKSPAWRRQVVQSGLGIVRQSEQALQP